MKPYAPRRGMGGGRYRQLSGAGRQTRIEHWRVAQQQGRLAAKNMLGEHHAFDRVPFFWTTHFGTRFEYLGYARDGTV
jgi:NADPH-dependent 2,4-dienoyl-CoA reductase/sulfur reductase-like enzyme